MVPKYCSCQIYLTKLKLRLYMIEGSIFLEQVSTAQSRDMHDKMYLHEKNYMFNVSDRLTSNRIGAEARDNEE
jgi:hypothetical protein